MLLYFACSINNNILCFVYELVTTNNQFVNCKGLSQTVGAIIVDSGMLGHYCVEVWHLVAKVPQLHAAKAELDIMFYLECLFIYSM